MKRLLSLLFIFSFPFLYPPTVFGQNCSDYVCVIKKVKKAIENKNYQLAFDNLESADSYPNKITSEIAKLRKTLFQSIEKEKLLAEKALDIARKQTKIAQIEKLKSDSSYLVIKQQKDDLEQLQLKSENFFRLALQQIPDKKELSKSQEEDLLVISIVRELGISLIDSLKANLLIAEKIKALDSDDNKTKMDILNDSIYMLQNRITINKDKKNGAYVKMLFEILKIRKIETTDIHKLQILNYAWSKYPSISILNEIENLLSSGNKELNDIVFQNNISLKPVVIFSNNKHLIVYFYGIDSKLIKVETLTEILEKAKLSPLSKEIIYLIENPNCDCKK